MGSRYDVVIVGGSLDSLVAAGYLAGAGRSVLVLGNGVPLGETIGTEELSPGFRGPVCFPSVELFHPSITRDLRLDRDGLTLSPGGGTLLPSLQADPLYVPPGSTLSRQLADVSPSDARACDEFERFFGRLTAALEPVMTRPLPVLEVGEAGQVMDLLRLGWRLISLGNRDAVEALRFLPMSVQDVADERFETDGVKALLGHPAITASWLGPRSPGSAYGLLHHRPAWCGGLVAPPVFVKGGPGALTSALADAARERGATVTADGVVRQILIEDGTAKGVVTTSGQEHTARTVVSALDPRRTLLDLVGPVWLEPELTAALTNVRCRGTVAVVSFALDALPRFATDADGSNGPVGRTLIGPTLDYLEQSFDQMKYGQLPPHPVLDVTVPTLSDPALAPPGKHVMVAWVQHVPFRVREEDWGTARERLMESVTSTIAAHAPGFDDQILDRRALTPLDLARRFGMPEGCVYHADMALDQLLYMRPVPGWYRYRTPIRNLYLCGPGTHPGGGVTGLPGKNAATQVLEDLKGG